MYSLSLIVGNLSTPIRLMYRSKERADACLGLISDHPTQDLRIEDDFGFYQQQERRQIEPLLLLSLYLNNEKGLGSLLHEAS